MAHPYWNDNAPIYRQLKERIIAMMLDGVLKPGDGLPSVRQIAAEYQLNPLTVSRTYQELAEQGLIEKRRGIGMFMAQDVAQTLLERERARFLDEQWPEVCTQIRRLGLSAEQLLSELTRSPSHDPSEQRATCEKPAATPMR